MELPLLLKGTLIKRYKSFLCDVKLENNEIITAHCPNSGSMLSVNAPLSTVYVSIIDNIKAKLKYKLELIEVNNTLVGINTLRANAIVYEALQNKLIPELTSFQNIKKEAVFSKNCRFDFLLCNNTTPEDLLCYVEVKNVTLSREPNLAEFPDAITSRGTKHAEKLISAQSLGNKSYLIYLIQREDCNTFSIAKDIDMEYYKAIKNAIYNNVKILVYNCKVSINSINIKEKLNITIS